MPNNETCRLICSEVLQGPYRRYRFLAPGIAKTARPGQFVHVQIPNMEHRILRRPFSICNADPAAGTLTLVCKIVGTGTQKMAELQEGTEFQILGPLGNGYSDIPADCTPVFVTGGYGSASTFFAAHRAGKKGYVLMGARTESDLILVKDYEALGFTVLPATNDGSTGFRGLVTELLLAKLPEMQKPFLCGCGPGPMLIALARLAQERDLRCEVSLDQRMCCGVGACFSCVVKVRDAESPDGWRYSRSCKEGPVYSASEVYCG